MKPLIAIIGRPNVGKSTLFNRIIGRRQALAFNTPGVTRDRHYATGEWNGCEFVCVDTGGFPVGNDELEEGIEAQIALALAESDVVLCLFDGPMGLISEDQRMVEHLRPLSKPIFYAVGKIDMPEHEVHLAEFYRLGLKKLYPVSGEHGNGVAELLDDLVEEIQGVPLSRPADTLSSSTKPADRRQGRGQKGGEPIRLAVIGRPNVGKSSLVNALLGAPRSVVSSLPGTTHDVVDTTFSYGDQPFQLLDTAGIRKKLSRGDHLERVTVLKAIRTIERADICCLLLAADEGLSKQDAHIASYVAENYRGLILIWNKMDLIDPNEQEGYQERTRLALSFVAYAPMLFVSAKTGQGMEALLGEVIALRSEMDYPVTTARLNRFLSKACDAHPMPLYKGREIHLNYVTQVGHNPPHFLFFANHPEGIPESYRRYLTNRLRDTFDLKRIPLKVTFRNKRRS